MHAPDASLGVPYLAFCSPAETDRSFRKRLDHYILPLPYQMTPSKSDTKHKGPLSYCCSNPPFFHYLLRKTPECTPLKLYLT